MGTVKAMEGSGEQLLTDRKRITTQSSLEKRQRRWPDIGHKCGNATAASYKLVFP